MVIHVCVCVCVCVSINGREFYLRPVFRGSKFIGLNGWAMSESLRSSGFHFLQQDEFSMLKLGNLSDDAEDGYIFAVDLHYPTRLYGRHDDYPLPNPRIISDWP